MRGSTKHVTVALATAASCILLFAVAMVLRYRVYGERSVSLTSGDLVPVVRQVSSVWCAAQTLRAAGNSSFLAYALPREPEVVAGGAAPETYVHYSDLRVSALEYWGFFLPRGSRMNLSTCARLPGATVTVLQGQGTLGECLDAFRRGTESDASEESEESEGDDDQKLSSSMSSSEGVITGEATEEGAFHCPHRALFHKTLRAEFSCSGDLIANGRNLRYLDAVTLESPKTDHYYVVFSTGAILDLLRNEIHWTLELDRTSYDLRSSERNCSSAEEPDRTCSLTFAFGSSQTFLVTVPPAANGSAPTVDVVLSTCEPRKGLYFVFFLLIFLAIGFCAFH